MFSHILLLMHFHIALHVPYGAIMLENMRQDAHANLTYTFWGELKITGVWDGGCLQTKLKSAALWRYSLSPINHIFTQTPDENLTTRASLSQGSFVHRGVDDSIRGKGFNKWASRLLYLFTTSISVSITWMVVTNCVISCIHSLSRETFVLVGIRIWILILPPPKKFISHKYFYIPARHSSLGFSRSNYTIHTLWFRSPRKFLEKHTHTPNDKMRNPPNEMTNSCVSRIWKAHLLYFFAIQREAYPRRMNISLLRMNMGSKLNYVCYELRCFNGKIVNLTWLFISITHLKIVRNFIVLFWLL